MDNVYCTDTESFLKESIILTPLILFNAPPRIGSLLSASSVSASGPPVNSEGVLSTVTRRPDAIWKNRAKPYCLVI